MPADFPESYPPLDPETGLFDNARACWSRIGPPLGWTLYASGLMFPGERAAVSFRRYCPDGTVCRPLYSIALHLAHAHGPEATADFLAQLAQRVLRQREAIDVTSLKPACPTLPQRYDLAFMRAFLRPVPASLVALYCGVPELIEEPTLLPEYLLGRVRVVSTFMGSRLSAREPAQCPTTRMQYLPDQRAEYLEALNRQYVGSRTTIPLDEVTEANGLRLYANWLLIDPSSEYLGRQGEHCRWQCSRCRESAYCECRPRANAFFFDSPIRYFGAPSARIARYVGMEIEVCGASDSGRAGIAEAVRSVGGCIKTDCSLPSNGFEITLPPMRGRAALRRLKTVCDALEAANAWVNGRAGGHVHVDARRMSTTEGARLLALWRRLETPVTTRIARSRVTGEGAYFSGPMVERGSTVSRETLLRYAREETGNILDAFERLALSNQGWGERYQTLNLIRTGWPNYGRHVHPATDSATVEFRFFPGAVSYERLVMHAEIASRIVDCAVTGGALFEAIMAVDADETAFELVFSSSLIAEMGRLGSPGGTRQDGSQGRRYSRDCGVRPEPTPEPVAAPTPEPTRRRVPIWEQPPTFVRNGRTYETAYTLSPGRYLDAHGYSSDINDCDCPPCRNDLLTEARNQSTATSPATAVEFPNDDNQAEVPF